MELFYDERDDDAHEARGSRILYWLDDLGAKPLREAKGSDEGFLFAGARSIQDYERLVARYPHLRDRPDERAPLLRLDSVLAAMRSAGAAVHSPKTWRLASDAPLPPDLSYPLFLRTAHSSLKRGGRASRVRNRAELESEVLEIRRLLGWDALIMARQWHELAEGGQGMHGPIPQEIRVWLVDARPIAWSLPPRIAESNRISAHGGRSSNFVRANPPDWNGIPFEVCRCRLCSRGEWDVAVY